MSMLTRVDKLLGYLDNLKRIRHSIIGIRHCQRRHLHFAYYHHSRRSITHNIKSFHSHSQIDLDDIKSTPSTNASQSQSTSKSSYNPSSGSLPYQIMNALSSLNINVQSQTHEAVLTSEEHGKVVSLNGILVKNLLVSEKRIKKKTQYLIMIPANKDRLNLKVLGKYLKVGGGLRNVSDPDVTFKMAKGCMTPLAVLFDDANIVHVIMDTDLQNKSLLVHPGSNEATISIKSNDLESYLKAHALSRYEYLNLDQFIGEAAKATDTKLKSEMAKEKNSKKQQKSQKNQKKKAQKKNDKKDAKNDNAKGGGVEKEGITFDKNSQFGDWYKEIVTKCDLIDYTDISGCYVLRPLSYFIWEQIQNFMDAEIKKLGVQNAYFPLFVSEDALKSESKHFEDFNPEVAWVTHSGDTELDKKIAVRPTSETIMYPMFSRWIRSFRDLPLKLNQWCNVVRWEFSNPTPFLRTREFLWQEGHTAHATQQSADEEVYAVLDMYARTYAEICAVPTIKGIKTKNETFPGADYTTTVEGYIPGSGRGIQGATSHCLGKNFAKMFKINYLDESNVSKKVIQNSWGFTTRSIGVMIMNHSDNKGLVLPPKVAQIQVVIIPIYNNKKMEQSVIDKQCDMIGDKLQNVKIRTFVDKRSGKKPGYKFNEWELKGVPVRIEIGCRDIEKNKVMVARRDEREKKNDNLVKVSMDLDDKFTKKMEDLLIDIHQNLYNKAVKARDENIVTVRTWKEFLDNIQNGKIVLAPHCNEDEDEALIAKETREYFEKQPDISGAGQTGKAKALCIPLDQPSDLSKEEVKCFHSGKRAKKWILFGRSY